MIPRMRAITMRFAKKPPYYDRQRQIMQLTGLLFCVKILLMLRRYSMEIKIIDKSDWVSYQKLRLTALKVAHEAFGSTYEREVQFIEQ